MGYNYSRAFLLAHKELANKLIALADSDGQGSMSYDRAEQASAFQMMVNNVLANLARNQPTLAYVRNKVRTWITWENEMYTVNVGVPRVDQHIKGPRPRAVEAVPFAAAKVETQYGATFKVSEPITKDNIHSVLIKLAAVIMDKNVGVVVVEVPPPLEVIKYIAEKMEPDFEIRQRTPQFILVRKG